MKLQYSHLCALCIAMQAALILGQEQQETTTTVPESPEDIAPWVVESACRETNQSRTEFYLKIREEENMTRQYPGWPNENG